MAEYICKKAFDMYKPGDVVKPYNEDSNELILDVPGAAFSHHIKKVSQYYNDHLEVKSE